MIPPLDGLPRPRYALYLAVLPFYREACMRALLFEAGDSVRLYAGEKHIDATVRSGIDPTLYTVVRNTVLASRALVQLGSWRDAFHAETTIVDLNPRSLTAWIILAGRRLAQRRTLVWGHLHPRQGSQGRTAGVRRFMRQIAQGTVLYGYDSVLPATRDLPGSPVWVAPNSLYRREDLSRKGSLDLPLDCVLYVGRLEQAKKVNVLIEGFAESGLAATCELVIIGEGSELTNLLALAESLGIADRTRFLGSVTGPVQLRAIYERAACSVSPGYVGLSITQSLGFGVPMIVSRNEPHSPEIELERFGGVTYFRTDDSSALAGALFSAVAGSSRSGRSELSAEIARSYSAETMAEGLMNALQGVKQDLDEDGWPCPIA